MSRKTVEKRWIETSANIRRICRTGVTTAIVGSLLACAAAPDPYPQDQPGTGLETVTNAQPSTTAQAVPDRPLPPALQRSSSRWIPVRWADLPGWGQDRLHEAWNAWLKGCERPTATGMPGQAKLCNEVRQLSIGTSEAQHAWLMQRFQPYRVTAADGSLPPGLLTGYYEPILPASRLRSARHQVPLYAPPPGLTPGGMPWFNRQQIDTLPAAKAALQGCVLAWLEDPLDALMLHIQGSGRLQMTEPDGTQRTVRMAFAGHNGHPYRSVARWLLDQGAVREGTWEAVRTWARKNPSRINEMLWANPRTVFFREEPLSELDARFGPRGAQGVPLTPGRSIAVDPQAIPYGTPVWLVTQGPTLNEQRLVLAQDTGSAIVGAARADYFTGWGHFSDSVYTTAAALKQSLQLWVLWPLTD